LRVPFLVLRSIVHLTPHCESVCLYQVFKWTKSKRKELLPIKKEKEREATNSVCVPSIVHKYKRVHKLVSKRESEKRGKCANLGASPFCNQATVSRVLVRH
jgi:hypothetical protein